MTLQQAKDEAAKEFGYEDWEDLMFFDGYMSDNQNLIDRAMTIYAEAKAKEAFEAARKVQKVNRVEVIDENGRSYVKYCKEGDVSLSFQDDERTLKVFINQVF